MSSYFPFKSFYHLPKYLCEDNISTKAEYVAPTPDIAIVKDGELVDGKASFNWSSVNGIGRKDKLTDTSGSEYEYYSDGAYLALQLKNESNQVINFNEVFTNLTLQTLEGGIYEKQSYI